MMLRRQLCSVTLGLLVGFAVLPLAAQEPGAKVETRKVEVKDVTLEVPANWKQTEPTGPAARLRLTQFEIPPAEGDDEPVLLVVSSFGGGGGGLEANLPRWLGEFEAEGRTYKAAKGTSPQGDYAVVDVSGTHVGPPFSRRAQPLENARLLAMVLEVKEKGNYFLKVSGPEKTIAAIVRPLRAAVGGDLGQEKPLNDADR
jgi:gluconolactonase